MHYVIEVNYHFIYHKFKRLWSVTIEQLKLSRMQYKLLRNLLTSLIIFIQCRIIMQQIPMHKNVCQQKKKKQAMSIFTVYFLLLWMKVLEQCRYFQLRLNSENNEIVQNVSIVGKGQIISIICPINNLKPKVDFICHFAETMKILIGWVNV